MEYRETRVINDAWESILAEGSAQDSYQDVEAKEWKKVTVPHNWEDYQGYHRVSHGNLHGTAWYRRNLGYDECWKGKRVFLFFEGVSSYADVWVNEQYVGGHKGGRTCFSLEITDALDPAGANKVLVRARHPEKINDLPWICGGCYGTPNTEGSQPIGIFRPVHIVATGDIRIKPFGVYITTPNLTKSYSDVHIESEIVSFQAGGKTVILRQELIAPQGAVVQKVESEFWVDGEGEFTCSQELKGVKSPSLWYPDEPSLYRVRTTVLVEGQVMDVVENSFGFRSITWENFDTSLSEVIDAEKLTEEPSEENRYFVTYTRGNENAKVAIIPGGVRVHLAEFTKERTVIVIDTVLKNQDGKEHTVQLESFVQTFNRTKSIANLITEITLLPGEQKTITQICEPLVFPDLWSEENPYLHNVMSTVRGIDEFLKEYCQTSTSFGIFMCEGIVNKGNPWVPGPNKAGWEKHRFLINGRHYFLNGTCEYEHELGNDHGFAQEMIRTRMNMFQAAGFNAFREAHCPHNLRYLEICEQEGILYWPQMGAHIYFDTEEFKENFRNLTVEWMKERRNSPAVILWGIQNESMLPVDFTREITELIRRLDVTSPGQRKAVTCNGGAGSDWNIPQNWSGTYGGTVEAYGDEAIKMRLIGEYGQYRVKGKHAEGDMEKCQNTGGDVSEELFAYCLETKVREAEKVREYFYGHFQWIMVSHANPGREVQYCLDGSGSNSVGVINSKGIFTNWGEPTDAYYMYRANYTPPEKEAVLYLVSHTWPDRFTAPCQADIVAYSNCEEVELYNDYGEILSGKEKRGKTGEHFTFRNVPVNYGILTAKGYNQGKCVAVDRILFPALPMPVQEGVQKEKEFQIYSSDEDVYRVNCGGMDYTDRNGKIWLADRRFVPGSWGCISWGTEYEDVEDEIGSMARVWDKPEGCADALLMQQFRYGKDKLAYYFPVPEAEYMVELYFMEPWYGLAGENAAKWRVFDVAMNDKVCIRGLDIWMESGGALKPLRKQLFARVKKDQGIKISFPNAISNQAVISAMRIVKV